MNIDGIASRIKNVDTNAYNACIERFNQIAKPIGSLGKLEELLARIAAITGSADIDISRKAIAVFCADNSVSKRGVTQHNHTVTTAVAGLLQNGSACVSVMAKTCRADIFAADIGMIDTVKGLRDNKLMRGANDITQTAAMERGIAERAVITGIETVKELKEKGYRVIAAGELGMGNTTASSAICSVLLDLPAHKVTGRGAGLSDAGLLRKIAAVEQAIDVNKPNPNDPTDTLSKLGGLDIAGLTGVFLGGGVYKIPVITDGFVSNAAALTACRICPTAREYILPSHKSAEPGARYIMEELNFSPVIDACLRLGEGTGAALLFLLLDMALSVYKNAATYADL